MMILGLMPEVIFEFYVSQGGLLSRTDACTYRDRLCSYWNVRRSTVRFCTWMRSLATHFIGLFCPILADPDRPIPKDPGIIVSPADGHVMFVRREKAVGRRPSNSEKNQIERDELTGDWYPEPCEEPLSFQTEQRFVGVDEGEESDNDVWRIAIFMSPLDVHVNRSPIASEIIRMEHRTGKVCVEDHFSLLSRKKVNSMRE